MLALRLVIDTNVLVSAALKNLLRMSTFERCRRSAYPAGAKAQAV